MTDIPIAVDIPASIDIELDVPSISASRASAAASRKDDLAATDDMVDVQAQHSQQGSAKGPQHSNIQSGASRGTLMQGAYRAESQGERAYKGKVTHRGWPQLPPELIRHILTFHLWNLAYHGYIPSIWESRDLWHSRMVFAAVRESRAVEGVMRVCKGWWAAIEHHPFWQQASALLDPLDLMAAQAYLHHGSHSSANSHSNSNSSSQNASHGGIHSQSRVSPYHHFRSLFSISCLVCRINYPSTNHGLAAAKRDVAIDIKDQKPGKVKPGTMFTTLLGLAPLCKEHDKKRMRFCGLCLRDSAACYQSQGRFDSRGAYDNRINAAYDGYDTDDALCCSENDDDETFPGVDVTCRSCRAEWLYVKAREHKADAEALGLRTRNTLQPVFGATDYETRSVVESFIELGEGTIRDVITIARDRQWLNKHTKLRDMLNQAVLASRFDSVDQLDNRIPSSNQLSSSIPSNRPLEEEEESEEEEDADFLHMTENDGVRDLALMDWARLRILDGFWMSPADQWYGYTAPGFTRDQIGLVRTVHPVAWSIEEEAGERGQRDSQHPGQEDIHPRFSIVTGSVPPSHALCEQAFMAHRRAMTTILLPAMKNVVRKIVLEANDGYRDDGEESEIQVDREARLPPIDPVIKAARMSPEDVVIALRDEGVWFEGVDWVERRRNETRTREANDSRTREANETVKGQGSDSSTNSSTSTSPVLSTTTLQTTPSPPPVDSSKQSPVDPPKPTVSRNTGPIFSESASSRSIPSSESSSTLASESSSPTSASKPVAPRPITIAVAPVLDPPRLLPSIPHVPVTVKHLPQFSLEAFKSVWREACAPLYHCRCSICERAQIKLNEANAVASNAAGTEIVDPIHVDAVDDVTKGIQVIPDRLNSPPLVEIEIGSPGVVEIGLEEGEKPLYEQDERKSRSSTFVARRLGEPGPPAGRLVPGREGRNLPSSRTLPASRTLPSRGTSPSRTRPPSRTLPSRDRHPLAQEEEEEELGEFDDYELDDYGTGEYEDYGSDFDSEYSDTPSRRRSISPKRQRSLSPIRHRSRSPSASRRFSRSISPLSTRSLSASERPRRAQTPAFSKTPPSSASRRASPRRILGPSSASLGPSRASPELEISSRPQTPISRKRACEDTPVTPPKRARHERSLSGSASPKGISGLESPKESFGEELSALKGASESSSTSQTPRKRSSEELDDALLGVKKRIRMSENVQPAT